MTNSIEQVNLFLNGEYDKNSQILRDGELFSAVHREEANVSHVIENLERMSEKQQKQQAEIIKRKYQVKIDSLLNLQNKLRMYLKNPAMLKSDDIMRITSMLEEMHQLLDSQKDYEIETSKNEVSSCSKKSIEEYREHTRSIIGKHLQEAMDKLEKLKATLNPLEQYYETASFKSEIWDNLEIKSRFPSLRNLRLGESSISIDCIEQDIVATYETPEIVPFFTQKSLTIVYNKKERYQLKYLIENIFLRSLMSAKPGNILFYMIDPIGKGDLFLDYLNFSQTSTKQILNNKIFTNPQGIDEIFKKMLSIYDDIEQNYLKGLDIVDYNQKSKVTIPYRVVILDAFPLGLSSNAMETIKKLARYEIEAGLHFVFLVEEKYLNKVEDITCNTIITKVPVNASIDFNRIQKVKNLVIDFTDLNFNTSVSASFEDCFAGKEWWNGDCSNFTTIPLGLAKAVNYDLEFDEEGKKSIPSAHMVIAGQTGCGKSFLLHSLIMALSIKYSPEDLKFFLIDLKGAEFKQYDTYKLPHAEFVAVNGNPEFGLHVLRVVRRKMEERNDEFKAKGVERLPEYRQLYPNTPMPRYFIIIDEYQRMLSGGGASREARGAIEDIAKVGRALGFNLILSSQSVMLDTETLGNFTHRIAMRCSPFIAQQALGHAEERCPNLKVGQAIVHQGSGYDMIQSYFLPKQAELGDENKKTRVDFLKEIAQKWEKQTNNQHEHNMIVFDGESVAMLENNRSIMHMTPKKKVLNVIFSPGEKILVDGQDLIGGFERGVRSQNMLVVGGKLNVSTRAINGCVMSMLRQFEPNEVKIDTINFINRSNVELYETIRQSSQKITDIYTGSKYFDSESKLDEWLDELLQDVDNRLADINSITYHSPRIIVFYQPENKDELHQKQDPNRPNRWLISEFMEKFMKVLEKGSSVGVHCIFHFLDPDAYYSMFVEDDLSLFGHRILLQMTEKDSKTFLGNRDASHLVERNMKEELANNRAIYYDVYSSHYDTIKPYEFYNQ
ncbi:FtsK/SpoIIIE domain-containing protein [Porphyromonas gingivalis]|uniref:FtsK/SpoIIIE domain-containing protein n=1 Tax=Porphyromonas gingivalis TaxID=837 RepID=UPI002657B1A2|nr:FtsK/SpoIIIE domain-containing protein [Porphyromonas gingivalis]MDP0530671.1 FtsK/SpoIIIE domain-containing protein [Porphyromonas gingivalis]MDP0625643.1 FtsK/SpoIIIE domain-containing protein [Porphyromonas gingivalis]WKD51734.1 FtsK/SpoIIIE domain-containing protein [Porphyromonas gingivalis]WKD53782.1 FtsK/SpoIIIE domain-containing protein [Porphyromonas gingivalis]